MHDKYNAGTIYRFWSKVDTSAGPDACWLWTAGRDSDGYGRFYVVTPERQNNVGAHRVSYELANGPIPEGLVIRHQCDNRPCVNPAHMLVGTVAENNADMVARGRMGRSCGDAHYSRLDPARVPRGVQKRQAKVNEDAVREMRQRHAAGERLCDIAAAFRIAQATAHQIVHRRSWRHVE